MDANRAMQEAAAEAHGVAKFQAGNALWVEDVPATTANMLAAHKAGRDAIKAVRYAHQVSGVPVIVTEHGVNASDDAIRARLIPAALTELKKTMNDGVPVHGYLHWSLVDNFEWVFGYGPKFGLHGLDRTTFARTPKPSATVLGAIARWNAV